MNFIKKIFIRGTIETITGLHISSYNEIFSMGILDYTIIRDPITQQPFIPGSTIKGKLRSLLELCRDTEANDGTDVLHTLFGTSSKQAKKNNTRIIFRDACLTDESLNLSMPYTDLPFTEIKKESYVDRTTGYAKPTIVERIPAGLFFKLEIILNIFENDQENDFMDTLFLSLNLLQDDYLGGRGTRGYGAVKLHIDSITEKDKKSYISGKEETPYNIPIPETIK